MPYKKVDLNHVAIVEAFRSHAGVSVFSTAKLGNGVPDLILGVDGLTIPVEVKVGKKKLNPLQMSWHRKWTGTPVVIIRSDKEAHQLIGKLRNYR